VVWRDFSSCLDLPDTLLTKTSHISTTSQFKYIIFIKGEANLIDALKKKLGLKTPSTVIILSTIAWKSCRSLALFFLRAGSLHEQRIWITPWIVSYAEALIYGTAIDRRPFVSETRYSEPENYSRKLNISAYLFDDHKILLFLCLLHFGYRNHLKDVHPGLSLCFLFKFGKAESHCGIYHLAWVIKPSRWSR